MAETLLFLSSGLFLGWSLGANDAANVFGTAVGARMVRFATAAVIASLFVVLGAVFQGAGAAHGLGKLGQVDAMAGAFMVALSAAMTVYWMTRSALPVSTTQAIVGAICGWNLFSSRDTDLVVLSRIATTWVAAPVLGAVFCFVLHAVILGWIRLTKPHMLRLDLFTRWGLIVAGAFGAFSLGANNIGNVMGVFIPTSPFDDSLINGYLFSGPQKLFLLGGVAIAVGIVTYSRRVMETIGSDLLQVSPIGAFSVVISQGLVLTVFASRDLSGWFVSHGLPEIPLIPVSSSQAVVGAVIGIALLKGRAGLRQVQWKVLGAIATGWVTTPILAGTLCFFALFVLQNVFGLKVHA
ncbi:MAG: PiT family inorganic phosphate transporter [Planctomycetota bacterium]|jgi:PiT family inorganic phosphate transporter